MPLGMGYPRPSTSFSELTDTQPCGRLCPHYSEGYEVSSADADLGHSTLLSRDPRPEADFVRHSQFTGASFLGSRARERPDPLALLYEHNTPEFHFRHPIATQHDAILMRG